MGQPAVSAPLPFELVYDDGEPLETAWHVLEQALLRKLIRQTMAEQGRTDFYVGTNQFVYYSIEQAREVAEEVAKGLEKKAFRGPDVCWVGGVDPSRQRQIWIAWEEGGRLPDLIVELLSPSTEHVDRGQKKKLYEQVFGTAEYFLYKPETRALEGLRLVDRSYRPISPDEKGRFWSGQLGVFLGLWQGVVEGQRDTWIRLFRPDGSMVPTPEEQAEAERLRAEAERLRAEAAEAEVVRLRALLEQRDRR